MDGSGLWIYGECVSCYPFPYAFQHRTNELRLSVFFVALADWVVFGLRPSLATYIGGALIIVAFGMLTKHTLGEEKH